MKAIRLMVASLVAILLLAAPAQAQKTGWSWYELGPNKEVRLNLYLFYSKTCPHCPPALEFAHWLEKKYPWVALHIYETSAYPQNVAFYQRMAASLNRAAGTTPAFFYCKQLEMGYSSYEQTGKRIEQELIRWHEALKKHFGGLTEKAHPALLAVMLMGEPQSPDEPWPDLPIDLPPAPEKFVIPGLGEVGAEEASLPALTFVLAACDSFNPCAFFVLLLLLSMLVHSHSRLRMSIVGGTFVAASGVMYFLFMAAWLNLFFVLGHIRAITIVAGLAAVVVGLLNVKDFFWWKRGPSLSIPESSKPGLFQRMAKLINVTSLPSLLIGSAALATLANFYELLCTSGFPMVYTRILTLRELPARTYYGYLMLYNLIYVTPMALIVIGFIVTLGSRKLTEYQGRVLKLLSGTMMLTLALVLLFWQEALRSVGGAVAILGIAIGATIAIAGFESRMRPRVPAIDSGSNRKNSAA
jgi:hypothetical protein